MSTFIVDSGFYNKNIKNLLYVRFKSTLDSKNLKVVNVKDIKVFLCTSLNMIVIDPNFRDLISDCMHHYNIDIAIDKAVCEELKHYIELIEGVDSEDIDIENACIIYAHYEAMLFKYISQFSRFKLEYLFPLIGMYDSDYVNQLRKAIMFLTSQEGKKLLK